jgi:hypothetical protein
MHPKALHRVDGKGGPTMLAASRFGLGRGELFKVLKRDLTLQLEKGTVNAVNEASLRLKLIQISCGAVYDMDHRATRVDCSRRLAVLREVIEEAARTEPRNGASDEAREVGGLHRLLAAAYGRLIFMPSTATAQA